MRVRWLRFLLLTGTVGGCCSLAWQVAGPSAGELVRAVGSGGLVSGSWTLDRLVADLAAALLLLVVGGCTGSLVMTAATSLVTHRSPRWGGRLERLTPQVARRLVAWCGLGLVGPLMLSGPAGAHGGGHLAPPCALPCHRLSTSLTGLPLPDLPTGAVRIRQAAPEPRHDPHSTRVVVRPGDSLWAIAVRLLPSGATTSEVAALTDRLYLVNRSTIGRNRDLIQPGMPLVAPKEMP